jgi:hypothetical protein
LKIGGVSRVNHYVSSNKDKIIYLLPNDDKMISKILKHLGYPKRSLLRCSKLPKPPKRERNGNGISASRTVQKLNRFSKWGHRYNWSDTVIDDITVGTYYYVKTDTNQIINAGSGGCICFSVMEQMLDIMKKKFKFSETVYGIRSHQSTRIEKLNNWIELTSYIKNEMSKNYDKNKVIDKISKRSYYRSNQELFNKFKTIEEIISKYNEPELKSLKHITNKISKWVSNIKDCENLYNEYSVFSRFSNVKMPTNNVTDIDINELEDDFIKKYPLLSYVDIRRYSGIDDFNDGLVEFFIKSNKI